jgi:hypothetical protein
MKHKTAIAACTLIALGVGATSATAGSLITSAKIKDGTIHMRDLAPSLQKKITRAQTTSTGASGANGKDGVNGSNGKDGANGSNGTNGNDGRDGVRWERVTGSCSDTAFGEVMVRDGALKFNLPAHNSYAQFKMPVQNLSLSDVAKLSLRVNQPTTDSFYLKLKLEGDRFVVFQPGTQTTPQETGTWVAYDVADSASVVHYSDENGADAHSLADAKAELGDATVKSLEITGGCAAKTIDGSVLVDDIVLNDEVIDFN